jgi:hypothetical protein
MFWGLSFEEVFARIGLPVDFDFSTSTEQKLRYIHRRNQECDWYFVSNPARTPVEAVCRFRVSGRRPELWNPETGGIVQAAVYHQEHGQTTLPIRFEPAESVFIVFRDRAQGDSICSIAHEGRIIQSTTFEPSGNPFRSEVTDVLQPGDNLLEVRVTNLWPNRLIGDEQPRPEPRRLTFSSWKHFHNIAPLLESGLAGPVVIRTTRQRTITSDR